MLLREQWTGAKTGRSRRIEIWFYRVDEEIYLTTQPARRAWYSNLLQHPQFTFHLKNSVRADIPATATPVLDQHERERVFSAIIADLNQPLHRSYISQPVQPLKQWKYFGLSEAGESTLRRAHAVQPISVLQTEYSLFERDVESLLPVLREFGIGLVPYSPLGRGFLTGTAKPASEYEATDMRTTDPRWQPGNFEKNVAATTALAQLAASIDATVGQLALAWLLAQGNHIVPIPGSRNPERVRENAAAADLQLGKAHLDRIAEILPYGGYGPRYTPENMPSWE